MRGWLRPWTDRLYSAVNKLAKHTNPHSSVLYCPQNIVAINRNVSMDERGFATVMIVNPQDILYKKQHHLYSSNQYKKKARVLVLRSAFFDCTSLVL